MDSLIVVAVLVFLGKVRIIAGLVIVDRMRLSASVVLLIENNKIDIRILEYIDVSGHIRFIENVIFEVM